jgi:putative transcriptional regulator
MSEAFISIQQGLKEAIAHAQGEPVDAIIHEPLDLIDVKAVRQKVGMTQVEFANTFGISLGTLRHWERGDRIPRGPARVLLHVVAKEPAAVLRAISVN